MSDTELKQKGNTRIGFHYFPDSTHYREKDLEIWLPELQKLKASWLVIKAETSRAIPEFFIKGLLEAGIEPIIHFDLDLPCQAEQIHLDPILSSYGKWGANYVIFFDLPNMRNSWTLREWAQNDLIKRFLDQYLPFAYQSVNAGLKPVLPPLEPGGSFWDTAFLRSVLESFEHRKLNRLVDHIALSAYAWSGKKSLNWGSGGPERWVETRPYFTPPNEQDQRGFRIFDWYQSAFKAVFHKECPIILLGVGIDDHPSRLDKTVVPDSRHKFTNLAIGRLAFQESVLEPGNPEITLEKLPEDVISLNFWLLSCEPLSPYQNQAWYHPSGKKLPIVQAWIDWFGMGEMRPEVITTQQIQDTDLPEQTSDSDSPYGTQTISITTPSEPSINDTQLEENITPKEKIDADIEENSRMNIPANVDKTIPYNQPAVDQMARKSKAKQGPLFSRPIQHYLLLPSYDWGISDWHLEVIRPFVKKYQPTIGFSLKEAVLANKVTIIGSNQTFPEEVVERLRASGCDVERISGDGTTIATELAKR